MVDAGRSTVAADTSCSNRFRPCELLSRHDCVAPYPQEIDVLG
jgi:hypothetical protein